VKKVNSAAQRIYFITNKAVLRKSSNKTLNTIAEVLKADVNLKLSIAGHTDSKGSKGVNNVLSAKRAEAVKKYLVKRGVSEDRLKAEGYGSTRPVADNATAAGRAKNRRVEMKVSNQ